MPLSTISLRRPPTSYAKVQSWIGAVVRNRRFQLRRPRVDRADACLNLGCGLNSHPACINLDYRWHPGVDVCWDVSRGLPFADGSLPGVFSEHCLEHFAPPAALALLRDVRRCLAPGRIIRLIVPDGELYLRTYLRHLDGDPSTRFPFQDLEGSAGIWTPMLSVNRVFYQDRESLAGHRTIFDFQLLRAMLLRAGLVDVRRRACGGGGDPRLLLDTPDRAVESLYVEASAPLS